MGKFIVFEGINGCGKTSLIRELEIRSPNAISWRFPSMGVVGQMLRHHLTGAIKPLQSAALLPLFLSDMLLDAPMLQAARKSGTSIFCDRHFLSTCVYQQDEWPLESLEAIMSQFVPRLPRPDLIVFLDIEPSVALMRCQQRGDARSSPPTLERLTAYQQRYRAVVQTLSTHVSVLTLKTGDVKALAEQVEDVIVGLPST